MKQLLRALLLCVAILAFWSSLKAVGIQEGTVYAILAGAAAMLFVILGDSK